MNSLIIEDNEISSKALKNSLFYFGVKSVVTKSAEEADAILKLYRPEIIFLDLTLPGRGGLNFLAERQADSILKLIPVIVTSGNSNQSTIRDTVIYGVDDYLIKPIQMSLLKASLIKLHIISI